MSRRIIIVDDEPFILRLIEACLRKGGHRVEAFRAAEPALEAAYANPPDLMLFDLVMPGMDGLTAIEKVMAHPMLKYVPVVLLTSKSNQLTEVELARSGAALYIGKPFSPSELLSQVESLFRPKE